MASKHILVVDDERDIQELVAYNLRKNGYQVTCVGSGEEALSVARSDLPDLIVLDLMLPGLDGLDVCRLLGGDQRTSHIPVLMLTARGEEADVVAGLELGADDYIVKPFSPRVLVARARAILRRTGRRPDQSDQSAIKLHGLTIDPLRRTVMAGGSQLELTFTEFNVLHFLARRPGWVFTRSQIIEAARGDDYPVTERSVDVQVVSLRKKLGPFSKFVETVRGVGYRLRE